MNFILNIFRWLLGSLVAFIFFITVFFLVPLSIVGKQVFVKETGMSMITIFANNDELLAETIDGVFDGIVTSNMIEDPAFLDMVKLAADKNSPLGKATRNVLTTESIRNALITNGEAFYQWLESDSVKLDVTYHFGGTEKDITNLVSVFLKTRYEGLPKCTDAQKRELGKVESDELSIVPCSVGSISTSTFDNAAKEMLSEKDSKEVLQKGISLIKYEENSAEGVAAKANVKKAQESFASGLLVTWIVTVFSALLMALLFMPKGVNFIASGIVVSLAGLSITRVGSGVFERDAVLLRTVGNPISMQGMYIMIFGLIFIGIGIWQLMKESKPKVVAEEAVRKPVQTLEKPKTSSKSV